MLKQYSQRNDKFLNDILGLENNDTPKQDHTL